MLSHFGVIRPVTIYMRGDQMQVTCATPDEAQAFTGMLQVLCEPGTVIKTLGTTVSARRRTSPDYHGR
jgi:hypothetical protein